MKFVPGDKVKFLNERGGGLIIRILPDSMAEIEDDHGFTLTVPLSQLVGDRKHFQDKTEIADRLKEKNMTSSGKRKAERAFDPAMKDYLMASRQKWTAKNRDFIEVDLHIEELTAFPGRLRDGEKLILQLEHARRCIDQARQMKIARVILIHGVGAGVLRQELRKWLAGSDDLDFHNADFKEYGLGATEVLLRGIFK